MGNVIGGKFDSTGNATDQAANCALVTKLMGEVRGYTAHLGIGDQLFLDDCLIKLNQYGSAAVFGWRQVQRIVEIRKLIQEAQDEQASASASGSTEAGS